MTKIFAVVLCLLIVVTILVLVPRSISAETNVIDFDTFLNGDPVPDGTVITDQYSSLGVVFSIDHPDAKPIAIASSERISPPNALTNNIDPIHSPVQVIRATFVDPADGVSPTTTDMVSFTYISDEPEHGVLEAYDRSGNLLGMDVSTEPLKDVPETLIVSAPNIAYVLIYPDQDVHVDDFTFAPVSPVESGVINGSVTDAITGGAIEKAFVIAIQLSTKDKSFAVTGKSGSYEMSDLPPGFYLVLALKKGYNPAVKIANVVAGSSTQVDFDLTPKLE